MQQNNYTSITFYLFNNKEINYKQYLLFLFLLVFLFYINKLHSIKLYTMQDQMHRLKILTHAKYFLPLIYILLLPTVSHYTEEGL